MPLFDSAAVSSASSKHPAPPNTTFEYGTAGFRTKAHLLDSVIFRVGLLASLRSKKCSSKAIGVMVTASHNPEEDNGVKLVDPRGEMLQQSWEKYATRLANATDDRQLMEILEDIAQEENVPGDANANVVYAMDTRPSGPSLTAALEDGIAAAKAKGTNYGIMTTPQLHYITRCLNTQGTPDAYGEPTEQGYYKKLAAGFKELVSGLERLPPLRVDCANGVGAPKLQELAKHIGEKLISVNIENANIGVKGKLNFEVRFLCGADFVKVGMKLPRGLENLKPGDRACALDGDADRIVYFYVGEDKAFHLLDGDKISGLAAMFIMDLVRTAGIPGINVGVVQTAYANGRSTKYLKDVLKVPVACTETGVKHLHHAAEEYDVGVYFEANGHGTVVFSEHCLKAIRSASGSTTEQKTAIRRLGALTEIINQTVGDALSDLLLVEAILTIRQWKASDWDAAYTDKPSRLVKVLVEDRGKFKTADADRVLTDPKGLQEKIEQAAARVNEGRSFVRPSGTEDCVRVYAEAATREECDRLAYTVAGLVYDLAGGKGGRPKEFL